MISKTIATIIAEISATDRETKRLYGDVDTFRKRQWEAHAAAEKVEIMARQSEIALEQLQLKLREALNSEPSSVPVEPPKEVIIDQIGREG